MVVSHDRQFLDNIVTSTFVLSGDGVINEYVGGYGDYIRQIGSANTVNGDKKNINRQKNVNRTSDVAVKNSDKNNNKVKLSYKEQHELKEITSKIEKLELEQQILQKQLNDPEIYKQKGTKIAEIQLNMNNLTQELNNAFRRWEELENT